MLTFSSFPDAESEVNPVVGSLTYQEVSLVFEVWDNKNEKAFWYPVLLFLDGPQAGAAEYFATPPILLGRELFGLPKIRGEIDFQSDLTGTLRCTFPTPQNVLMNLGDCIKVSLKPQMLLKVVMNDLEEVERALIKKPSDARAKKKKLDLLQRRKRLTRELNDLRRLPIGRRYHPFEVVNKLWGDSVREHVKNIDRRIIVALDKVKGSYTDAELAEAVNVAMSTGFFAALSMTDVMIGGPLLGLRQIHNPINFMDADHQLLIVARFDYNAYPLHTPNSYTVEFFSDEMREWLGLDLATTSRRTRDSGSTARPRSTAKPRISPRSPVRTGASAREPRWRRSPP